jgi:hypothetical protein
VRWAKTNVILKTRIGSSISEPPGYTNPALFQTPIPQGT